MWKLEQNIEIILVPSFPWRAKFPICFVNSTFIHQRFHSFPYRECQKKLLVTMLQNERESNTKEMEWAVLGMNASEIVSFESPLTHVHMSIWTFYVDQCYSGNPSLLCSKFLHLKDIVHVRSKFTFMTWIYFLHLASWHGRRLDHHWSTEWVQDMLLVVCMQQWLMELVFALCNLLCNFWTMCFVYSASSSSCMCETFYLCFVHAFMMLLGCFAQDSFKSFCVWFSIPLSQP